MVQEHAVANLHRSVVADALLVSHTGSCLHGAPKTEVLTNVPTN